MTGVWVVVADSSRANIYGATKKYASLDDVRSLANPAGHLKVQDLTSDLPGRTFDRHGQGRHAMEQHVDAKRQAIVRFAHDIGDYLEAARTKKRFDGLVLVAPPEFLGVLRKVLSQDCRTMVSVEIAKNLVTQNKRDIRDYLSIHL